MEILIKSNLTLESLFLILRQIIESIDSPTFSSITTLCERQCIKTILFHSTQWCQSVIHPLESLHTWIDVKWHFLSLQLIQRDVWMILISFFHSRLRRSAFLHRELSSTLLSGNVSTKNNVTLWRSKSKIYFWNVIAYAGYKWCKNSPLEFLCSIDQLWLTFHPLFHPLSLLLWNFRIFSLHRNEWKSWWESFIVSTTKCLYCLPREEITFVIWFVTAPDPSGIFCF